MLYLTSDNHYDHINVLKYCNRPFENVEDMNEHLIHLTNKTVPQNAELWYLGDFALNVKTDDRIRQLLRRINCQNKYLVLGNHDHRIHKKRAEFIGDGLFKAIYDYKEISYQKQKICLMHFPMRTWNGSHWGSFHCHGHTHGDMEPHGKSVDVGVDSKWITGKVEYRPFHFDEIKRFMDNRELVNHHGNDL